MKTYNEEFPLPLPAGVFLVSPVTTETFLSYEIVAFVRNRFYTVGTVFIRDGLADFERNYAAHRGIGLVAWRALVAVVARRHTPFDLEGFTVTLPSDDAA